MRHTRNMQLYKLTGDIVWRIGRCFDMDYWNSLEVSLDKSFKWHSEAVEKNFWSNVHKSCVSFKVPDSRSGEKRTFKYHSYREEA